MMRGRRVLSALVAAACFAPGTIAAQAAEAEYLRLRPHKEPAQCVDGIEGNCPLVEAPRINRRRSTIPGVANPDFGRPQVFRLPPPPTAGSYSSPYRTFGGNRGISGLKPVP
jgi:hypothetical protein